MTPIITALSVVMVLTSVRYRSMLSASVVITTPW